MHPRHRSNNKTKSAALLAAEAAFAPPKHSTERHSATSSPEVSISRVKRAATAADLAGSDSKPLYAATAANESRPEAPRVPRVFLLKSAARGADSTVSDGQQALGMQADARAEPVSGVPGRGRVVPKRVLRAKHDHSGPAPVTVIYSAGPAAHRNVGDERQRDDLASHAYAQDQPPVFGTASLTAALAEIEPIFAAISAAMAFKVEDPQAQSRWESLSKELDQVAAELSVLSISSAARSGAWGRSTGRGRSGENAPVHPLFGLASDRRPS